MILRGGFDVFSRPRPPQAELVDAFCWGGTSAAMKALARRRGRDGRGRRGPRMRPSSSTARGASPTPGDVTDGFAASQAHLRAETKERIARNPHLRDAFLRGERVCLPLLRHLLIDEPDGGAGGEGHLG
jgi:hypothetical protein